MESSSGWTDASHSANMTILMGIVKDILTQIKPGEHIEYCMDSKTQVDVKWP